MFVLKERKKKFLPHVGYSALERPPRALMKKDSEDDDSEAKYVLPPPKSMLVDAETGEALNVTKARWTTKEGRLALNARTILAVGTGKLDIHSQVSQQLQNHTLSPTSHIMRSPSLSSSSSKRGYDDSLGGIRDSRHPLIDHFLSSGPLTPYMHVHWDKRSNTIKPPSEVLEIDNNSIGSESSSSTLQTRVTNESNALSLLEHPPQSSPGSALSYSPPSSPPDTALTTRTASTSKVKVVPSSIALSRSRNWNAVLEKTFIELYAQAEKLELNKSMTQEKKVVGGLPEVRRICQDLARMRVKQMKELVQAVEDEAQKEAKREQGEMENFDKELLIGEMKKRHREERQRGKLYIEALQRDQEILFMHKMKDMGMLW